MHSKYEINSNKISTVAKIFHCLHLDDLLTIYLGTFGYNRNSTWTLGQDGLNDQIYFDGNLASYFDGFSINFRPMFPFIPPET